MESKAYTGWSMRLSEASEKLVIPRHRLDYWKSHGLLSDADELNFSDLVKARFIHRCRSAGVSLQAIRNRLEYLSAKTENWPAYLYLDPGHRLLQFQENGGPPLDPESGQFYFCFEPAQGSSPIEFESKLEKKQEKTNTNGTLLSTEDFPGHKDYLRALSLGQFQIMEDILKKALNKEPDNLAVKIELGNLYYEKKDTWRAMSYYEDALAQSPSCVEALYNLANIHLQEKRYAAAIRYYRDCLALDPGFAEVYYNLGLLLLSLNYHTQALECMEQYCLLDPDSDWGKEAAQLVEDLYQYESISSEIVSKKELLLFPTNEPDTSSKD